MGLLDDAIREHLELKRRHGADETEVSRLETEAFGPVRVPAPTDPPVQAEAAETAEEPQLAPADPEPQPASAATAEEPQPAPADPEPPHGDALEGAVPDRPSPPVAAEPWLDEPDEVPLGERLDHAHGQATTEFTPEDRAAALGEPGYVQPDEEPADDVLEETPDFLQETPEHDRLWFEQRPPKDFDFGG